MSKDKVATEQDRKETEKVYTLLTDALTNYETLHPKEEPIKDIYVYNAAITLLYHLLYYTHGDNVVEIRKALDSTVNTIVEHARKTNLTSVKSGKKNV